jgi:E3 ubiquitin-protein ligase UHRF1
MSSVTPPRFPRSTPQQQRPEGRELSSELSEPDNLSFAESFPHSEEDQDDDDVSITQTISSSTRASPTRTPTRTSKKNPPKTDPGLHCWPVFGPRGTIKSYKTMINKDIPRPDHAKIPTFGHLPGLYIGKSWYTRLGALWDGTHTSAMGGIAGRVGNGVWSVCLSGGYEDDVDEGYRFLYTGSGGREKKVHSPSLFLMFIVLELRWAVFCLKFY